MDQLIFITGGGRSGKSAYAQRRAEALPPPRKYLATCPPIDAEMRQRITRHQAARAAAEWETIEETLDLAGVFAREARGTILLDCLTLWINNLMYDADRRDRTMSEDQIATAADVLLTAARKRQGTTIFVSNEVGMGIIPENPMVRRYRDLVGRCNQVISQGADEVVLLVSGIPMIIKDTGSQR